MQKKNMKAIQAGLSTGKEAITQRCSVKKVLLEILQNSQENTVSPRVNTVTDPRVSFLIELQAQPCNFIKKESLAQVFSCEVCHIFKNIFS